MIKDIIQEMKKYPTARYEDNKIKGCPKGSLAYYHEEGHVSFEQKFPFLKVMEQWYLVLALTAVSLEQFLMAQIILAVFVMQRIAEETYAWEYAFKKRDQ
ncbi:MAG TPA: hypothetical protein VJ201_02620 [Candidatus Babeliales bacterium]|nr:hypothetical protein [Candidatus Babeliales bacterium]